MPIRSIDELRNWAGPDWKSASDEDLISMYSRAAKVPPTEVAMTLGYDPGSGGVSAKQLSSSVDRYQAGLYGVGEAVTGAIGLNKASGWLAEQRRANELQADVASARAREMGAVDTWKDVKDVGDFGSYAKSLAIQSLPYAGEAVVGGLAARGLMSGTRAALTGAKTVEEAAAAKRALDIGSTAGGVAASYPSAVGDILSNQREQSGGKTDLLSAGGLGVLYAGLNAVGVDSALMRGGVFRNTINLLDRPGGLLGAATRTVATGTGVALKEGISETGQEVLNQAGRMAVDPNATLTDPEAIERYKESFAGGATLGGIMGGGLGGWRRSTPATNEIQQAFDQPNVSGTPTTNVVPPATPPAPQQNVPVVAGGTTDIAQAQQQAQIDNQAAQIQQQQAEQAQAIQAQRDEIGAYFGAEPAIENGKLVGGTIFGKSYADPEKFNAELDKLAQNESVKTETRRAVEKAYMDSLPPEKRKLNTIQSGALQFWANKPDIAAAAVAINEAMSELVVKGKGIDDPKVTQFAQMYEALTGAEAPAYDAATKVKPKGAKDGKLSLQTTTGLGTVPVQGGTGETNATVDGNVQPSGVQPVGAGGLPEGSLGLQVGQPSTEGIRDGTSAVSDVGGGNAPSQVTRKPSPETNQLLRQIFGDVNEITEVTNPATGGQALRAARASVRTFDESKQTKEPPVVTAVSEGVGGSRQYEIPTQYYNTDIMHISPERRGEIILQLFRDALAPQTETAATLTAEDRVEIVTLSLMEGMTAPAIAAELSTDARTVTADAVQKQRQRLGITETQWGLSIDQSKQAGRDFMASLLLASENFKSPEFPDGLSAAEVGGLYSAKDLYYSKDKLYHSGVPVQEETEQRTVNNDIKLQEELYKNQEGAEATQSAGEIKTAGGAQGNIDSLKQSRKGVLDMGALDQINALEQEAETLRAAIEEMAPKDPRLSALEDRLESIGDIDSGELGALWAQYAKAQALRTKSDKARNVAVVAEEETAATEELTGEEIAASEREDERKKEAAEKAKADKEGTKDAVQESSAEEVPVREGATGGKAVGKGNAKRGKAAGKAEVKQEAKPEEIKTPAEEWADISKLAPELPPYDLLAKSEKTRWDDLVRRGQANLAAAVKIVGEKPQPASAVLANEKPETTSTDGTSAPVDTEVNRILRLTRGDTVEVTVGTLQFDGQITDEASLRRFPGVDSALSHYENNGLRHVLDKVQLWMVAPDTVDFDAAVMLVDGKQTLAVRSGMLVDADTASWSMHHEMGHVADEAFTTGGILSDAPELNLTIKNGVVKPMGKVVSEVMTHMAENPDSEFTRSMGYPLNHSRNDTKNMTSDETRMEVFAQLWAFFNTRIGNEYLADNLPLTYDFMEASDEAAKQNKGNANAQTGATATTAAPQTQADRGAQRITPAILRIGRQGQESTADQVISALPKPLQKSARARWTNIKSLVNRGLYASAITEDLAGMAKKYMPSVSKYLQAQYNRQATRLSFERRIEDILVAFDKLPQNLQGEGKNSVNAYIYDSTREKKWGYYPGEHQVGTKLFEVDPDFKERFDAFPPAAQKLIKDVFQHGYEALKMKQNAAVAAVEREFIDREKNAGSDADLQQAIAKEKKQMLKRISSLHSVNVGNPYAYLGRYGDYVVTAKSAEFKAYEEAAEGAQGRVNPDYITGDSQQAKNWLQDHINDPTHYVVEFAETQGEADAIAADLIATGQYDLVDSDAHEKEANASYSGGYDLYLGVKGLRTYIEKKEGADIDPKLDRAIGNLYLMLVAESSARQRKNVAGASKNMMRNLATSGRADAHFLASMEHSDAINESLAAMQREARRGDSRAAMPIYNELYTRHANSLDYEQTGTLSTALTRMTTLWTLSMNPAYYLQQLLQTMVFSLPYMSGRLGYFRSARALKRAYGDMAELVKGLGVNEHINFDKAPADVRFMLKQLVDMGKIDLGIDAESKARADEQGALGKTMLKLQGINTRIESINRATAAIAAYRAYTDRYKGATGADGVRFAADVVSNTHGSYDAFNTPRVLQGDVARVALQFKRFQIIQLSMLAKLIHTSFKGASKEEKAIARASLSYITAHMAVLGGALGVPFVSQAAWIISKLFGDEDEPDNFEYKLRRMIGDDAVADLLLRGVPAAVGLESLGKKLSMENVASPFGPFVEPDLTSRAGAEKMLVGVMGPAANLGLKFTDALGMMTKGNYYKGLELALPNGVANAMKGYRFANEGITMRNGDLVMKPEDISMIDAAFQAVGLPTTTITDRQYTQKVVAEFDKFYASRAGEIKSSYVEGSRQSDAAAMAEARDDWQKLQESRVRNGYKRQSMSELFRAPAEARKRERGVVGGVETTKSNRRFVELQTSGS